MVCGTDASGGWFAVVHLDGAGALPSDSQQAIRSWEGGAYVEPIDQRFACVIGDIDNDQRNDLVVLAGKQNGFPSLVLHRGTGDAQVFRTQGERLTWADRELRNTSPRAIQLEFGPSAVVACFDGLACLRPPQTVTRCQRANCGRRFRSAQRECITWFQTDLG